MRARYTLLVGCLSLAPGCRQPNPDWLGPESADAADLTTDGLTTGDATTGDATAGATGTSSGPMCQIDDDCAEPTPFCLEGTCVTSGEGTPCQNNGGCPATAPFCNPNDECQDGSENDPCAPNGQTDCSAQAPHCVSQQCHDGSPGDPCGKDDDCTSGTCTNDQCE